MNIYGILFFNYAQIIHRGQSANTIWKTVNKQHLFAISKNILTFAIESDGRKSISWNNLYEIIQNSKHLFKTNDSCGNSLSNKWPKKAFSKCVEDFPFGKTLLEKSCSRIWTKMKPVHQLIMNKKLL